MIAPWEPRSHQPASTRAYRSPSAAALTRLKASGATRTPANPLPFGDGLSSSRPSRRFAPQTLTACQTAAASPPFRRLPTKGLNVRTPRKPECDPPARGILVSSGSLRSRTAPRRPVPRSAARGARRLVRWVRPTAEQTYSREPARRRYEPGQYVRPVTARDRMVNGVSEPFDRTPPDRKRDDVPLSPAARFFAGLTPRDARARPLVAGIALEQDLVPPCAGGQTAAGARRRARYAPRVGAAAGPQESPMNRKIVNTGPTGRSARCLSRRWQPLTFPSICGAAASLLASSAGALARGPARPGVNRDRQRDPWACHNATQLSAVCLVHRPDQLGERTAQLRPGRADRTAWRHHQGGEHPRDGAGYCCGATAVDGLDLDFDLIDAQREAPIHGGGFRGQPGERPPDLHLSDDRNRHRNGRIPARGPGKGSLKHAHGVPLSITLAFGQLSVTRALTLR